MDGLDTGGKHFLGGIKTGLNQIGKLGGGNNTLF